MNSFRQGLGFRVWGARFKFRDPLKDLSGFRKSFLASKRSLGVMQSGPPSGAWAEAEARNLGMGE